LLPDVQDPETAVYFEYEEARQANDLAALEKLIGRTEREKMIVANFDVRLALAKAELKSGRRDRALARAAKLADDAAARGYALIAKQARALR